jgi:uncharacterized RDD family membrane protein YckC
MTAVTAALPQRRGHYSGFVSRFVAYVIDIGAASGVFTLALAAISFAASVVSSKPVNWDRTNIVVVAIYFVWLFIYFAYSWAVTGKTFGMAVLGIRVLRDDGEAAGARRAIVRTLALPLSFLLCGLGFLGILVGEQRRALHDVIAGTCVVYSWDARAARLRFLARDSEVTAPPARDSGLPRRDPPQQFVHDAGREARLRRGVVVLAPGHHRAGEGEHGHLDVGVGAELAGGDAAAQH